ncbi:unnamed protein product [Toxocara canis]|uniref:EGF-like domain-containing protein n=1 Tax=Toxocara canis TaxID=6265 RepID=A0A183UE46_TOXCA|nr:unnamed protein product [Toxocara canis]
MPTQFVHRHSERSKLARWPSSAKQRTARNKSGHCLALSLILSTTINRKIRSMRQKVSTALRLFVAAIWLQFTPLTSSFLQDAQIRIFKDADEAAVLEFDAVDPPARSENDSATLDDTFIFNRSSHIDGFVLPLDDPDEAIEAVASRKRLFAPKVAEFDGDAYVKLDAPPDVDVYLELSFHLKPIEPDGLVYLHCSKSRCLAIYLENGYLNTQYSLGADRVILRSAFPLTLNGWHKAEIWRSGRAGLMKVDHHWWIENRVSNDITHFERTNVSFFGGAPEDQIPFEMQMRRGFSGCIKKVIIDQRNCNSRVHLLQVHQNGRPVHLLKDALSSKRVHECGWDPCTEIHCGAGARCVDAHSVPICMCRFPTHGPLCEHGEFIFLELNFSYHYHLIISISPIIIIWSYQFLYHWRGVGCELFYKAHCFVQILIYAGDEENVGDFLHLLLTNRSAVQLILNLGSGITTLTHPSRIQPNKWYNIAVTRQARQVSLSVNGSSITTTAPPPSVEMNVYDAFYIGGTSQYGDEMSGFVGCIQRIRIGFEVIDSPLNVTESINVSRC